MLVSSPVEAMRIQLPDADGAMAEDEVPGPPPVPPGALRLVNFAWHTERVAMCAEEPGPLIEFGSFRIPRTQVWVRDGTTIRQLAVGAGACDPAWSPDGDWLAVVTPDGLWVLSGDLRQTVHLFDVRRQKVSADEFENRTLAEPVWAPDASALAVLVSTEETTWVEVIDVRTGENVYSSEPDIYDFAWGEDSQSLRFGSRVVRLP